MKDSIIRKAFIFGIIILFVGAIVTPSINGVSQTKNKEISPSRNTDCVWWPMFQHDLNHSGYSTSDAPETNNVKWTFNTNGEGSTPPTVFDNKVYVGIEFNLYCLDADNGNEIWSLDLITRGTPAVVNDRLYISGSDFYCLDANDGSLIWNNNPGIYGSLSSPAVSEGKVYVGCDDANVYCLDADDGTIIWTYTTGDVVHSSPAVKDGRIYIGSEDEKVYCLDAEDGDEIWNFQTGIGGIHSSPAVSEGKVYVGSNDDYMYCLDAEDGDEIWNFQTGIGGIRSSPAIAYGKVYFASGDTHIYCLDANTGQEIWYYDTTYGNHRSSAVADDKVFVATTYQAFEEFDHYIECLDADTGDNIWSYKIAGSGSAPAVADGKVYISSGNGKMYCFGEKEPNLDCNGSLSWNEVKPGSIITGNFTVENIGEPATKLDWEIIECPTWGTWSFSPSGGEDLTPEDGPFTVEVEVIAPDEKNKNFIGNVTVCNQEDPCDYCEIPVTLTTPKNKPFNFNLNLLGWLFERFPNAFPILRYILGL